jgi:hypothetical protein
MLIVTKDQIYNKRTKLITLSDLIHKYNETERPTRVLDDDDRSDDEDKDDDPLDEKQEAERVERYLQVVGGDGPAGNSSEYSTLRYVEWDSQTKLIDIYEYKLPKHTITKRLATQIDHQYVSRKSDTEDDKWLTGVLMKITKQLGTDVSDSFMMYDFNTTSSTSNANTTSTSSDANTTSTASNANTTSTSSSTTTSTHAQPLRIPPPSPPPRRGASARGGMRVRGRGGRQRKPLA